MHSIWSPEVRREPLPEGVPSKHWPDKDGWHIVVSTALSEEAAEAEVQRIKALEIGKGHTLLPGVVAALGRHVRQHALPAAAVTSSAAAVIATAVFAVTFQPAPGQIDDDTLDNRPDVAATAPQHPTPLPPSRRRSGGDGRPGHAGASSPRPTGVSPLPSVSLSQVLAPGTHPLRAAVGSHPLAPVRSAVAGVLPHLPVPVPSLPPHPLRGIVSHLRPSLPSLPSVPIRRP